MKSDARCLVLIALITIVLLVGCNHSRQEHEAEARPNLVLIVIDALRAGDLSCYGADQATSPGIDALAATSTRFTHALSVGGNTTTAMPAMMTGRLPCFDPGDGWTETTYFGMHRFYRSDEEIGLPHSLPCLAELLGASGYSTAAVITNPFVKRKYSFDRGFAQFTEIFHEKGIPYGLAEEVTAEAVRLLGAREARQEPFFLYLHYMDVHGPYLPPDEYRNALSYPRVCSTDRRAVNRWKALDIRSRQKSRGIERLQQHIRGLYHCSIRYADHHITKLVQYLSEQGLMERTIVVITSDHGEEFLEHGGTMHKGTLYDELVRIPLIIHVPRQPAQTIDTMVRNFDLMPTLLDYAGVGTELPELDAVSIRPLIEGGTMQDLSVYASFPHIRMYRNRHFKLLSSANGSRELFDLRQDPGEQANIYESADQQLRDELERRLEARYQALLGERAGAVAAAGVPAGSGTDDRLLISMDEAESLDQETRDQLRKLGYLEE
jgi:arylsulfatase A-like enzyme